MPRQTHKRRNTLGEQGFASIVIALVLIIVLALLTIGFAQLARREQKNALDKQLATQAYYAAESGVNDTEKKLPALEASGNPTGPNKCQPGGPVTIGPPENGVQYTCVLVNLEPPSLIYDNIQPETMRYVVSSTSNPASSITVNWGSAAANNNFPSNANDGFIPAANWTAADRPAVIEFSVTPLADLNRDALMDNSFTLYLYPTTSGSGSVAYNAGGGGNNGAVVSANCNATPARGKYPCQATITGVSGSTGPYLFRIISHYDSANVSINGKDIAGAALGFDGQTRIDVTGKAHEVLKRIQVHRPKKPSYDISPMSMSVSSACKHFTTDPLSGSQTVSLSQDAAGACGLTN